MKLMVSVLLALAVMIAPASAKQPNEKQRNAMNHIAQVQVIKTFCTKVVEDRGALSLLMVAYDINLSDPDQGAFIEQKIREHGEPARKLTEDQVCALGLMLYGPSGANVRGLVRAR